MATRPLSGIGNTGITGGTRGIDNQVPLTPAGKTEPKTETKPESSFGGGAPSTAKLEGQLSSGAVSTPATASTTALWGDTSPKAMAQAMVDDLTRLAKAAERGEGGLEKLALDYRAKYDGFSPESRAAVDVLWTAEGTGLREQLNAAVARLAKSAPDLVIPGNIADYEKKDIAQMPRQKLLDDAAFRLDMPLNRWQPHVSKESLASMSDAELRKLLEDIVVGSRARRAGAMPLEQAVAEAQFKKDPAAIRAAAQAIVSLGAQGVADLGAMMKFYEKLATAA